MRVVVQGRDQLLRELLGEWLRRHPSVSGVVLAADGAQLYRLFTWCRPDAVVIDAAPDRDVEPLLQRLRLVAGEVAILLLVSQGTVSPGSDVPPEGAAPGTTTLVHADSLVTLSDALDQLSRSIAAEAASGSETDRTDAPTDSDSAPTDRARTDSAAGSTEAGTSHLVGAAAPLTGREIDVLRLLSLGSRSVGIGEELGVSAHTVENHKRRIFAKLGAHSETQAVAEAIRLGLVHRPPTRGTARLTRREAEIINLAAAGNSVKQTARALNISVKTVESIQSHLFRKLGVSGRTGAVAVLYGRDELPGVSGS